MEKPLTNCAMWLWWYTDCCVIRNNEQIHCLKTWKEWHEITKSKMSKRNHENILCCYRFNILKITWKCLTSEHELKNGNTKDNEHTPICLLDDVFYGVGRGRRDWSAWKSILWINQSINSWIKKEQLGTSRMLHVGYLHWTKLWRKLRILRSEFEQEMPCRHGSIHEKYQYEWF